MVWVTGNTQSSLQFCMIEIGLVFVAAKMIYCTIKA